jgi:hypothetical protein
MGTGSKQRNVDNLNVRYLMTPSIYKMGWACGTYGGRERCAQGVGGETRGKETIGETKA